MKDSQKTRLALVVSANLVLAVAIGGAIWNSASSPKKVENNKNLTQCAAVDQKTTSAADTTRSLEGNASENTAAQSKFSSTNRQDAIADARRNAGRANPMAPVSNDDAEYASAYTSRKKASRVEPQVIPEPPQLPIGKLPIPPEPKNPPIVQQFEKQAETPYGKLAGLKITGIIGNKAMFLMRREGARRSDRPEIICLAPGEQVRTMNSVPISVIQVEKDKVTLDVDGDRLVKTLPEIR